MVNFQQYLNQIASGSELDAFEASKVVSRRRLSKKQIEVLANIVEPGKEIHNQQAATYALAWLWMENGNAALKILIEILETKNLPNSVRGQAAEGIGLTQPKRRTKIKEIAANSLISNLKDPSPEVRFWCCYAVGSWRLKEALIILHKLKEKDHSVCPGWWYISEEASDAIDQINGKEIKDRVPISQRKNIEQNASLGPANSASL